MKLLKFSRVGCVPCQVVGNLLNDKEVEYEEVDVTEDEEIREKYDIHSVPVLILVDDQEQIVGRVNGLNPTAIEELLSKIN
jgi:glutaredoxin